MPIDVNLPETAKALSAPLTKLIDVIGAGCGAVYEPTGIRRRARAEADAMVIMEEARIRASALSLRAAQRALDVEERRQQNIESITSQAVALLPESVAAEPVLPDWAARFFAECQDISDEQMRSVWARILVGEVARPGSFSTRTLSVLKNLAPAEAQLFNGLVQNSFKRDGTWCPMACMPMTQSWYERNLGLDHQALERLQDAGLITVYETPRVLPDQTEVVLEGTEFTLRLYSDVGPIGRLELGHVSLTTPGVELARICEWSTDESRVQDLLPYLHSGFKVEKISRAPDGQVVRTQVR
jgi:hypothetical protein